MDIRSVLPSATFEEPTLTLESKIDEKISKAWTHITLGEFEKGKTILWKKVLVKDPENKKALLIYAKALAFQENYETTIEFIEFMQELESPLEDEPQKLLAESKEKLLGKRKEMASKSQVQEPKAKKLETETSSKGKEKEDKDCKSSSSKESSEKSSKKTDNSKERRRNADREKSSSRSSSRNSHSDRSSRSSHRRDDRGYYSRRDDQRDDSGYSSRPDDRGDHESSSRRDHSRSSHREDSSRRSSHSRPTSPRQSHREEDGEDSSRRTSYSRPASPMPGGYSSYEMGADVSRSSSYIRPSSPIPRQPSYIEKESETPYARPSSPMPESYVREDDSSGKSFFDNSENTSCQPVQPDNVEFSQELRLDAAFLDERMREVGKLKTGNLQNFSIGIPKWVPGEFGNIVMKSFTYRIVPLKWQKDKNHNLCEALSAGFNLDQFFNDIERRNIKLDIPVDLTTDTLEDSQESETEKREKQRKTFAARNVMDATHNLDFLANPLVRFYSNPSPDMMARLSPDFHLNQIRYTSSIFPYSNLGGKGEVKINGGVFMRVSRWLWNEIQVPNKLDALDFDHMEPLFAKLKELGYQVKIFQSNKIRECRKEKMGYEPLVHGSQTAPKVIRLLETPLGDGKFHYDILFPKT